MRNYILSYSFKGELRIFKQGFKKYDDVLSFCKGYIEKKCEFQLIDLIWRSSYSSDTSLNRLKTDLESR